MNRYSNFNHKMDRLRLGAGIATALASMLVQAAPPPTSPAPVVNYEYDANGNRTKTIQAKDAANFNFTTKNQYDALNRVTNSTNARSGVTKFGYDGQDNLTSVTDPRSLVTEYPRNGLGATTSLASPDTGPASYTYDAAGNVKTRTDSQAGKTPSLLTWTYDKTEPQADYGAGIGRLSRADHPNGFNRYTYDIQGRVTREVQQVNPASGANAAGQALTVDYGYDAVGRITSIKYPSGRKLTVTYIQGQPTSLDLAKDAAASTAVNLIKDIKWEPFGGGVKSWLWNMASGPVLHERTYDQWGRLVRYPLSSAYRDLTYDEADRIKSFKHSRIDNGSTLSSLDQSFSYDELGRLTGVSVDNSTWTINYDANGNRTSVTLNGAAQAYTTADTSNRLTEVSNPARKFGIDVAGNTESDTGAGYTAVYSTAGRLLTLTKGGVTTTYSYDNQGRRIRKYSSGGAASTVLFAYDQQGQLLGEYDSAGKAIREYVWLGTTPVAVFTPDPANEANAPLVYYIHADHLDTPRLVMDRANKRRWRWMAEPFGTTAAETNPDALGAFAFPLRHPGQYADVESGLFYNWNRYFDPSTGRYISADPIGLAGTSLGNLSLYPYANNAPTKFTDPTGLAPTKAVVWLVKICKTGIQKIRPVSYEEAVTLAKKGEDLQASRDMAKKIGNAASKGRGAIKDPVHPDRVTGSTEGRRPHYHANPRNGGHIFYGIAAAATVAGHVDCEDCTMAYIAEAVDFFNPLSLPKDLMDLTGIGTAE